MGLSEKDKVDSVRISTSHLLMLTFLEARRFITFIDACYDSRTRLFVSSEVPIFEIFSDDSNVGPRGPPSDHMRSVMDELV